MRSSSNHRAPYSLSQKAVAASRLAPRLFAHILQPEAIPMLPAEKYITYNGGSDMTRKEAAMANFMKGYNCSQSVVLAFADMIPIDEALLLKLSSSFGGGIGRLREVCGAASGMFMVAGLLYGYGGPETGQIKTEHYARIQELAHRFEEKHGSIVCRELLGLSVRHEAPVPEARTKAYYKKRPCPEIVGDAAEILEQYISEQPV